MYSNGNAGMAGGTTGNTGIGSVSSGSASDEASREAVDMQTQGMALLSAKLSSELEMNKSVTNSNNANADRAKAEADRAKAEADKLRGADTDNTMADTAKKQAETTYQNIQNEIAKATQDTVIDTVKQGLMKLEEEANAIINNNEIVEAVS